MEANLRSSSDVKGHIQHCLIWIKSFGLTTPGKDKKHKMLVKNLKIFIAEST